MRGLSLVLVILSFLYVSAFFDTLGDVSGGSAGGCGGGAAPEPELPAEVPINVIFAFVGAPFTGKSFAADRLNSILNNQSQLNVTSNVISYSDYILRKFAASKSLDFNKLKTDFDYRSDNHKDLFKFTIKYKGSNPSHTHDANDYLYNEIRSGATKEIGSRRAFVLDDLTTSTQLAYLQSVIEKKDVAGLELITIELKANEETLKTRGAPARAKQVGLQGEWTFSYNNDGNGAEAVTDLDFFLANTVTREIAK